MRKAKSAKASVADEASPIFVAGVTSLTHQWRAKSRQCFNGGRFVSRQAKSGKVPVTEGYGFKTLP